jgi:cell shape-determining protein MreC
MKKARRLLPALHWEKKTMPKYDVGELITVLNEAVNKLNNLRTKYDDLEKERDALRAALQTARRDALEEAVSRVKAYSQNETARNIVTIIYALGEKE